MKLTTKGRYAVTAMLDVALHGVEHPVSLAEISRRQDISVTYLEQLFGKLRKRGLVESVRGPGGGYRLALEPAEITVARVIYSVDETVDMTRCAGQQNCQGDARCLTHDLWMGLNQHVASYLNGISLADLVEQNNVKLVADRQNSVLRDMRIQQEEQSASGQN